MFFYEVEHHALSATHNRQQALLLYQVEVWEEWSIAIWCPSSIPQFNIANINKDRINKCLSRITNAETEHKLTKVSLSHFPTEPGVSLTYLPSLS